MTPGSLLFVPAYPLTVRHRTPSTTSPPNPNTLRPPVRRRAHPCASTTNPPAPRRHPSSHPASPSPPSSSAPNAGSSPLSPSSVAAAATAAKHAKKSKKPPPTAATKTTPAKKPSARKSSSANAPAASSSNSNSSSSSASGSKTGTSPAATSGAAAVPALFDVLVVGAGPAGLSLAAALAARSLRVALADPVLHRPWPNHYGVWEDEFAAVGLADCASSRYPRTSIFTGPGDEKILLDRAYIRVDRVMLKRRFLDRCEDAGVVLLHSAVNSVDHVCPQWSVIDLAAPSTFSTTPPSSSSSSSPSSSSSSSATNTSNSSAPTPSQSIGDESSEARQQLRARIVVDCTGHALRFTDVVPERRGRNTTPWEQAAYGIEAEVEGGYPFAKDEMVLMDFRDSHMGEDADGASEARPTFVYVFPEGERRAFFEETSVIQPSAVAFDELRERLLRRLDAAGVQVTRVIEEERSLIPMGGPLPDRGQRVVAFGGAAQLVHPATGYMVGRTVRLAERVADRVQDALALNGPDADAAAVAKAVWDETWSLRVRRQRDFLWFGAELLGTLGMRESRAFFRAFFKLPAELWTRFLGYELDSPAVRILFALRFFVVAEPEIRVRLLRGIAEIGGWRLIRSTLPDWLSAWDED